jgi:drug/metabolite transporter (DMT)-like permease
MVLAKGGIVSGVHPISANTIRISAGLVGLVIFAAGRRRLVEDFRRMADRKALLLTAAGALVGPVLGIVLTLYAFQWAPVGIVTTLMQTSPILLLPVERFFFKKRLPLQAVAGTVLAIGGAALLFIAP